MRSQNDPITQSPDSWRGPELGADGYDSVGYGSGDELLVIGRIESGDVGGERSDLNGNRGGDNVIERTERCSEGAGGDLNPFQHSGDARGGRLAERHEGRLGGRPGAEGTVVLTIGVG